MSETTAIETSYVPVSGFSTINGPGRYDYNSLLNLPVYNFNLINLLSEDKYLVLENVDTKQELGNNINYTNLLDLINKGPIIVDFILSINSEKISLRSTFNLLLDGRDLLLRGLFSTYTKTEDNEINDYKLYDLNISFISNSDDSESD